MKPISIAASSNPDVDEYIVGVLSGQIVACRWVRLAVERHIRDLETGEERGLHFDEERAQHVIDFFEFLKHSKGEWAGQVIKLEPWQQFALWVLFGWTNEDGRRRFRTAYFEVARKNGKSTMLSGLALYLMVADGEPGAEIYSAATKREQAKITWSEATRMVKASPYLRRLVKLYRSSDNLSIADTASKFEPLGRDSDSMDGLNIHGAIVDELHAHKTRDVWDLLETATSARRQPMMLAITTAGFNRQSICYEQHDYTEKVLEQVLVDDTFFGIIFALDADDDWEDEAVWPKANPNWDVSIKPDDLRRKAEKAKEMPSALNAFLRLHMNQWTQAESRWLAPERWRACAGAVDAEGLRGRTCYGGLDLSTTTDISAFVLVFPPEIESDPYRVLCRFWIPEENMRLRSRRDRVPYDAWVRQGFVMTTPGDVIDYDFIIAEIDDLAQRYDIHEIAFDRWGATAIYQKLEEQRMTMIQFGQGFASMSPPAKELEKLVLSEDLAHGGNPVLSWMADNLVVRIDPAGNIKPDKEKSIEKIDGMVALIMALDRAIRHAPSIYDSQGIREI
ncbi:MAG: terminase TerL endonuclease subunit [Caldilineaceae bacterium]